MAINRHRMLYTDCQADAAVYYTMMRTRRFVYRHVYVHGVAWVKFERLSVPRGELPSNHAHEFVQIPTMFLLCHSGRGQLYCEAQVLALDPVLLSLRMLTQYCQRLLSVCHPKVLFGTFKSACWLKRNHAGRYN